MTVTLELNTSDSRTRRTLSEISLAVAKSKRIVVVTGAGISCSCGIPDFRSSDGLYALVKERFPDVVLKGRDLFDASLFRDPTSTAVFYTFISGLKRSIDGAKPSPTHHFIKTLDVKKRLLRSYTQNIDGFEAQVGLLSSSCESAKSSGKGKTKIRTKDVRNVQLHGDIHRVRCMACSAEYPCNEEHLTTFGKGEAPDCPECLSRSEARVARSARAIRVGSLRPGIVLYDESHPLGEEIGAIHSSDLTKKPDMLIIMGTSLKVHGLRKLVRDFARTIHGSSSLSKKSFQVIFVNKTAPSSEWSDIIDYHIEGETDAWSSRVIDDWKKHRPADWEVQQTLDGTSKTALKTVKPTAANTGKPRKDVANVENIVPVEADEGPVKTTTKDKEPVPPLSPSKRRQKASHYDDLQSSPSKRQSTSKVRPAVPAQERKLLFAETTNKPLVVIGDKSAMDISICDLSMRDAFTDSAKAETSTMDISISLPAQPVVKPARQSARSTLAKLPARSRASAQRNPSERTRTLRAKVR